MAHNPIISQQRLGMAQPTIGITQRGVRYDGRGYYEMPDTLAISDLLTWRNHTLIIVDCNWHSWKWVTSLPSNSHKGTFEWKIEVLYRVADAVSFVGLGMYEIESNLERRLLPSLAETAARFRPQEHKNAAEQLRQTIIEHGVWGSFGLEVDPGVKVIPSLSSEDEEIIYEFIQLERAATVPQAFVRKGKLPTSEPTYRFDVIVDLLVQVADPQHIDSLAALEKAVDSLWKGKVRRALARISRQYTYRQLAEAGDRVDQELENEEFSDYGLVLVNASAELSLGERATAAAIEDTKLEREIGRSAEQWKHIGQMALKDRASAVAAAVGRGEMTVREALSYFDEQDLKRYRISMETLEKLRELDILGPDEQVGAAREILSQSLSDSSNKSLPDNEVDLKEMLRMLGTQSPNTPALQSGSSSRGDEE